MAALSPKIRSVAFDMSGNKVGIAFFCPGCDESHAIPTRGGVPGASWQWDGNVNAPTVTPSIKITIGPRPTVPVGRPDAGKIDICHSFVREGQIQFLGDCTHAFAGRTVPLPDWPADHNEAGFYLAHPHDKVGL